MQKYPKTLVHVNTASNVSSFAMELDEFLVNHQITASCPTNMSPKHLSKETNNKINFEKLFFKTHNCNPFQSSLSLSIPALFCICIGNSMICSDIWHKYHEWYFEIVIRISRVFRRVKFETTLKYHEWHLWQISVTNLACVQTSPLPHKKIGRRDVCESPSLIAFPFIIYANVTGTRLTTAIHRRLFYRFFSEGRGRLCTGYYKSCYYLFCLSHVGISN